MKFLFVSLLILVIAGCVGPELTRLEMDAIECSTKTSDYCDDVRQQVVRQQQKRERRNPCPFGGVPVMRNGQQIGCHDLSRPW